MALSWVPCAWRTRSPGKWCHFGCKGFVFAPNHWLPCTVPCLSPPPSSYALSRLSTGSGDVQEVLMNIDISVRPYFISLNFLTVFYPTCKPTRIRRAPGKAERAEGVKGSVRNLTELCAELCVTLPLSPPPAHAQLLMACNQLIVTQAFSAAMTTSDLWGQEEQT